MKLRSIFIVFLVVLTLVLAFATIARAADAEPMHPQLAALVAKLNSAPTYGGEFREVKTSRMRATTHGLDFPQPPTVPTRFAFYPGKLRLDPRDPDKYAIPAIVTLRNIMPQDTLRSVRVLVNGIERGYIEVDLKGLAVDQGVDFLIPLFPTDAGTLRLTAIIYPRDGSTPEVSEWDYDVPSCRVPEIIAYPNPPHGVDWADFVGRVHGLPDNLMLGFAMVVWTEWPELFKDFDPNKPRSEWPAGIKALAAPMRFESGYLKTGGRFWPSLKASYAFIVPVKCGRFAMSDVQQFYTDDAPQPKTAGLSIEVIPSPTGNRYVTTARITLQNAPRGGWLESHAEGYNAKLNWWNYSYTSAALVEAKDGPQERIFQYYLFEGFVYSIHVQYFAVNDRGWLELLLDASTPQNIPGTYPCWFCGGPGNPPKG